MPPPARRPPLPTPGPLRGPCSRPGCTPPPAEGARWPSSREPPPWAKAACPPHPLRARGGAQARRCGCGSLRLESTWVACRYRQDHLPPTPRHAWGRHQARGGEGLDSTGVPPAYLSGQASAQAPEACRARSLVAYFIPNSLYFLIPYAYTAPLSPRPSGNH